MNTIKRLLVIIPLLWGVARADTWRLADVRWNGATDSVRLNFYEDGSLLWSLKKASVQAWDTTVTVSVGHRYEADYAIYYSGETTPSTWAFQRDLTVPGGTSYPWYIAGAQWSPAADSAKIRQYSDTLLVYTSPTKIPASNYSTTLTAYVGKYNTANVLIWYPGDDSAATWSWVWDLSDTSSGGQISTPTNPNRCLVYGKIILQDGSKREIVGGVVEITRSMQPNAAANASGINVMISGLPTYAAVDSSGFWQAYLIGTHEFTADTTRGFYNFRFLTRRGKELFNLARVWVPSAGALNLSDTLNARVR